MSKNVLVVGSINVDYVIHTDRLPTLGETLSGEGFAMNFGGKGANQAVALAKAGCNVRMLGAVGTDLSGDLALQNLAHSGVDASEVLRVSAPTGAAVITVCGGDNHIILDIGANACVTPQVIDAHRDLFEWADFVVMQYEIPMESVLAAAQLAKEYNKTVILNPAPVKEADPALYRAVDYLIPNEFEAELITGTVPRDRTNIEKALLTLRAFGCRDAIMTLGDRGCAYTQGEAVAFSGVYDVKRVDTTAAGDSFIGGLCARLCEGDTLPNAISYASATSAIAVSRPGAAASIPVAEEVRTFMKCHKIGDFAE